MCALSRHDTIPKHAGHDTGSMAQRTLRVGPLLSGQPPEPINNSCIVCCAQYDDRCVRRVLAASRCLHVSIVIMLPLELTSTSGQGYGKRNSPWNSRFTEPIATSDERAGIDSISLYTSFVTYSIIRFSRVTISIRAASTGRTCTRRDGNRRDGRQSGRIRSRK